MASAQQLDSEALGTSAGPDVVALVRAAQAGDRGAFAQLHRLHGAMVHAILLSRSDPGAVDDLVQDVFLTALKRLADLRDAAAFPGWLAQIARRRAVDHHRRGRSFGPLPDQLASRDVPRVEAAQMLERIQALPPDYAEILIMRLVEGLSGPEIAARTGLEAGYVRLKLHRGVLKLRRELEGEGR